LLQARRKTVEDGPLTIESKFGLVGQNGSSPSRNELSRHLLASGIPNFLV
jgi:hypothetical protein